MAGAANVPDVQKAPLREVLAALEDSHQKVQVVSTGCGAVGYTVPSMERQLLEAAKRHQVLFAVAAKTYNDQPRR